MIKLMDGGLSKISVGEDVVEEVCADGEGWGGSKKYITPANVENSPQR